MLKAIDIHKDCLWGKTASPEEIKKILMPGWAMVVPELDGSFYCYHSALFFGNGKKEITKAL
jgi:hypothetical protein